MTHHPAVVAYLKREHPRTGVDEVIVVEDPEELNAVRVVRELGELDGTRYVEAELVTPVPAWDARWATLTLEPEGPFADLLVRRRAVAYVTRERDGQTELLTIETEGHPEDGIQVPAGRLEHGETLEEGLLRELAEETGLTAVRVIRELPDFESTYRNYSHNHAFHLVAVEATPESWRHEIHGDGVDAGLTHICRWVPLDPEPELWHGRDPMLGRLERVSSDPPPRR